MKRQTNIALTAVKKWLDYNKLSLNVSTGSYILFRRKQRKIPIILPSFTIQGSEVKREESTKFLGITFGKFSAWKNHVLNVTDGLANFISIMF